MMPCFVTNSSYDNCGVGSDLPEVVTGACARVSLSLQYRVKGVLPLFVHGNMDGSWRCLEMQTKTHDT